MIELRKMENRKFRTFGWVQDPSDFKSLYNVVQFLIIHQKYISN